jgi:hypothetical protein
MATPRAGTPSKAEQKQARLAAVKAAAGHAQRRERRIRLGVAAGAVLVVAALIVVGVLVFGGSKKPSSVAIPSTPASTATGRDSEPPWAAPADASGAVAAAGLPMLGAEGTALHIHAHLDVIVNGRPVTVPAEVGIDEGAQKISPLHTHDTTGVIHIESPTQAEFSLGQFFSEWQVSLSGSNIGALKADGTHLLKTYVNGQPYTGDPAGLVLKAHDEIALVYGTAAQQTGVPSAYQFPAGY